MHDRRVNRIRLKRHFVAMSELLVLPGLSWVTGEHPLPRTSPTKAVLPFICAFRRSPRFRERPTTGSDEGRKTQVFSPLSTTKPFAGSLPYVRRHLTTSKKPQVATCPTHLVLSHDKPGWTELLLMFHSVE